MLIPEPLHSTQSYQSASIIIHNSAAFADQLRFCYLEKFTGRLDLRVQISIDTWNLYFYQGILLGASGGTHSIRRWYRYLSQHCPHLFPAPTQGDPHSLSYCSYDTLIKLLAQGKIQQQSIDAIAKGVLVEIFFDLCQQWAQRGAGVKLYMQLKYARLDNPLTEFVALPVNEAWRQATQEWEAWQQAGLEDYSPNQAPQIRDPEKLQQQVLPATYRTLTTMMDGCQPLRDLAIQSHNHLLTLTKSLVPYLQQNLIYLRDVRDLPTPAPTIRTIRPPSEQISAIPKTVVPPVLVNSAAPLIAYIDDHPKEGQKMHHILTQIGYRFLHIQDPLQALPLLLEHKPNLIFLDLVMPIVNGYETCAQVRRISKFKDTPIIILTSNDGIVDRVRAKIVGSTGFLAKPIEFDKVQTVLQKYLLSY